MKYDSLIKALRTKKGMVGTVEVDPNYGKYHFDGHRACNVCLDPKQTKKLGGICPTCGKGMTIGVLNRVEELADRPEGYKPKDALPFYSMISTSEIISILMKKPVASKHVWAEYNKLLSKFGNELNILLDAPLDEMKKLVDEKIADTIILNRQGKIKVNPGYDGEYGVPVLGDVKEIKQEDIVVKKKQTGISEFM
jgi:PHP family Zn ribbon phosphoesterase